MLKDNILPVTLLSNKELIQGIAHNARQRRLANEWTRDELSEYSKVSVSSIKRFEREGKISLDKLIAIAFALDAANEFKLLFPEKTHTSIKEIISSKPQRMRGRRKNANQ